MSSLPNERPESRWREAFLGADPYASLPRDRQPPRTAPPQFAVHEDFLRDDLLAALRSLALQQSVTLPELLLAAYQVLLWRYTGHVDLVVGFRFHPGPTQDPADFPSEAEPAFSPIRTPLDPTVGFTGLLGQVRQSLRRLPPFSHGADAAWRSVLDPTVGNPDRPGNLFPVGFGFGAGHLDPDHHLLDLHIVGDSDPTRIRVNYDGLHFQPAGIRWFATHYRQLLVSIAGAPAAALADLQLITPEEEATLRTWSRGAPATGQPNFSHQRLERAARDRPDAAAVIDGPREITFAELNRRANQLGHYLQARGVGPEVVVAIVLKRSIDLVVATCSVHKAGGTLLLLDPESPPARLAQLLELARPAVVIAARAAVAKPPDRGGHRLLVEDLEAVVADCPDSSPDHHALPAHTSVLYLTSGSTGLPKLVVEPFGYLRAPAPYQPTDRLLLKSDSGTTFTVAEALNATWGVPVYIVPEGEEKDLPRLAAFIRRHHITRALLTPSALQVLLGLDDFLHADSLKSVFCIGEVLPAALKRRFLELRPDCRLLVNYGSTEARACLSRASTPEDDPFLVDAGRPTAGMEVYVLDAERRLCPIGVPGELHIGGQIATGYLNDPEATRAQFIPHPFDPTPGARLFATRDRARFLPDGTVEILGRSDGLVKVRGYRVEIGEVEAVLASHPAVTAAAVLATESADGTSSLIAFLTRSPATDVTAQTLRHWLAERLPEFMVPADFLPLAALPLTSNGKIDRQALRRLAKAERARTTPLRRSPHPSRADRGRDLAGGPEARNHRCPRSFLRPRWPFPARRPGRRPRPEPARDVSARRAPLPLPVPRRLRRRPGRSACLRTTNSTGLSQARHPHADFLLHPSHHRPSARLPGPRQPPRPGRALLRPRAPRAPIPRRLSNLHRATGLPLPGGNPRAATGGPVPPRRMVARRPPRLRNRPPTAGGGTPRRAPRVVRCRLTGGRSTRTVSGDATVARAGRLPAHLPGTGTWIGRVPRPRRGNRSLPCPARAPRSPATPWLAASRRAAGAIHPSPRNLFRSGRRGPVLPAST